MGLDQLVLGPTSPRALETMREESTSLLDKKKKTPLKKLRIETILSRKEKREKERCPGGGGRRRERGKEWPGRAGAQEAEGWRWRRARARGGGGWWRGDRIASPSSPARREAYPATRFQVTHHPVIPKSPLPAALVAPLAF